MSQDICIQFQSVVPVYIWKLAFEENTIFFFFYVSNWGQTNLKVVKLYKTDYFSEHIFIVNILNLWLLTVFLNILATLAWIWTYKTYLIFSKSNPATSLFWKDGFFTSLLQTHTSAQCYCYRASVSTLLEVVCITYPKLHPSPLIHFNLRCDWSK